MPELIGYEATQALCGKPWRTIIKLIALTGWGQASDGQKAIEASFDHHLTKPVHPDALQALLSEDVLRQSRSRSRKSLQGGQL